MFSYAHQLGYRIGMKLAEAEKHDANALAEELDQLTSDKEKQKPVNNRFLSAKGDTSSDNNTVSWGPEQAVDSRNDLSTWGGFERVSTY